MLSILIEARECERNSEGEDKRLHQIEKRSPALQALLATQLKYLRNRPEQIPRAALLEMVRVSHPGGTIAAYVWDYVGKMELIRFFWDAMLAMIWVRRAR